MKRWYITPTLFFFLFFLSTKSFSQSAILGAELIKLGDQLQQAIDDAKNAGLNLEVEAGREVALSLENFKNVYASSLNLTMDKLDTTATKQFETLKSLISSVQDKTVNSLSDFTSQAQQIINSLPFRKHEPQLTSTTPQFIVPSSIVYDVVINCKGNFEAAGIPNLTPTLTIGNKVYTSSGTNQVLQFHVPIMSLMAESGISPDKFGYIKAFLQVPWKDSKFLGIFSTKKTDQYSIYIGTLPQHPGSITLIHTIDNPRHTERDFVSQEFYQTSGGDGGNNDHQGVPYLVTPSTGWNVVRNTSRFNVTWQKGDWSNSFTSDDANRVSYNVTTIHHTISLFNHNDSGQVRFKISFKEYLDDSFETFNDEQIVLNWGDSKSLNDALGKWKIVFKSFDGSTSEFIDADITNPFLKISKAGMNYIISTADPGTLKWPQ